MAEGDRPSHLPPHSHSDETRTVSASAVIQETVIGQCGVCWGAIRRRGRHGRWVHVIDGNSRSTMVCDHEAEPGG